jgi:hypothetical protein
MKGTCDGCFTAYIQLFAIILNASTKINILTISFFSIPGTYKDENEI